MIRKLIRVVVLWKFRSKEMTEAEQIADYERTRPKLRVIYEHSNPADPDAMLVMHGCTKVGYINADDKRWLVPLMEKSRRGVTIDFDHVMLPSEGEGAILKYSVEVDETTVCRHLDPAEWEQWQYRFPQLDTTDSMDTLNYAIGELMGILEGDGDELMSVEECVQVICENCRYDLSAETSERLDACCFALEMKGQHALLERLEMASTHRRGRRGMEEWRTWFAALVRDKRADRLLQMYKNEVRRRMGVSRVTRQQIVSDLLALEQMLYKLPHHLDLYLDDPAQMMHMAFYSHIPEVKQLELLSALVLRVRMLALVKQDASTSDCRISEQIELLLDELQGGNLDESKAEDSGIRFKGSQTALMYVLEAMHKADWFTDAEGKPIRSKDKVIKAVMRHAFGIENPNLSQLRNAAKNRNYKQPSDYFDDLKSYLGEE